MLKNFRCIDGDTLLLWNKVIGMRNALVHDYLDIDEALIVGVLKNNTYVVIFEFAEQAVAALKR